MAAAGTWFDFASVTVIYPVAGTPTTVTLSQSTEVSIDRGDGQEPWQPGGAIYPTVMAHSTSSRNIMVRGGDCYKLSQVPADVDCTVSCILKDSKNGTGEGALTVTLAPCRISNNSFGVGARKFAQADATFMGYSTNGTTDPMTIVATAP